MVRRILIGYDGSERGDDALALGRALAGAAHGAEVLVTTVYEQLSPKSALADERPAQARLRVAAEEVVAGARRRWPELDEDALQTVCANSPSGGLHRFAEEHAADVIVTGSSHRSPVGRIWPGSVADRTLHGSPCAVAVAPPGFAGRAGQGLRRIGVGFDGTPEARAGVREAARLAAASGATLVLVWVISVESAFPVAFDYTGYVSDLHEVAQTQLADAAANVPEGVPVERREIEGRPADELVAADLHLDLLVLGSRGYGPVRRVLLGGVSSRVVRRAPCPVLVVTRPEEAPQTDGTALAAAAESG